MTKDNHLFDDMARMAGSAMGSVFEASRDAQRFGKEQFEKMLSGLHFVPREEFEAAQAMIAKAREEQEKLAKRVEVLERHIAGLEGTKGL